MLCARLHNKKHEWQITNKHCTMLIRLYIKPLRTKSRSEVCSGGVVRASDHPQDNIFQVQLPKNQYRCLSSQPLYDWSAVPKPPVPARAVIYTCFVSSSGRRFASISMPNNRTGFQTHIDTGIGPKNKATIRAKNWNTKSELRQSRLTLCVPVSGPEFGLKKGTTFIILRCWNIRTTVL